jgi:predicted nuclease with RNAse H fold
MRVVGIDVQIRRGCPFVVLDEAGEMVEAGWLGSREEAAREVRALAARHRSDGPLWVGVDAPRQPLPTPRTVSFRSGRWQSLQGVGKGRHCEIVVKSLGLANPQWTPLASDAPDWMRLGFSLFEALEGMGSVLEVFPTASYRALHGQGPAPRVTISFNQFAPGPKDMLDAIAAAMTAQAHARGRGAEVGGGDGLGTIILPRPLTAEERASAVHRWPTEALDP